jgi:replicative DNA helicase
MESDCANFRDSKPSGISTGLFDLNRATGGWKPTNIIILASRPGIGKTSLCLHFAESAAKKGKWVNFYGLEMSRSDLMRINISGETGINRTDARDGRITDEDWNAVNIAVKSMERLPIIWNDQATLTVNHIRSFTAKNRKIGKCDLIIIDYLQLITPTDKKVIREQQIAEISRELKKLALKEKVPIIIAAQLNREATEGEPKLHHLRESGSLEQDADIVIFPWVNGEDYTLSIAKHRRGMKGSMIIGHNSEMTKFYDNIPQSITHTIKTVNPSEPSQDIPF